MTNIFLRNKENCALKLVDEIILYYDARSIKHQLLEPLFFPHTVMTYEIIILCSCTLFTASVLMTLCNHNQFWTSPVYSIFKYVKMSFTYQMYLQKTFLYSTYKLHLDFY